MGWIVPRAAVETDVAFTALASAGILPYEQVKAYVELTGGEGSDKPFPSKGEIARKLENTGAAGVDPQPHLEQMNMPALWLFGTADREIPVDQCVELLEELKEQGKEATIVVFQNAEHGLLDTPPSDPNSFSTLTEWILGQVH